MLALAVNCAEPICVGKFASEAVWTMSEAFDGQGPIERRCGLQALIGGLLWEQERKLQGIPVVSQKIEFVSARRWDRC